MRPEERDKADETERSQQGAEEEEMASDAQVPDPATTKEKDSQDE